MYSQTGQIQNILRSQFFWYLPDDDKDTVESDAENGSVDGRVRGILFWYLSIQNLLMASLKYINNQNHCIDDFDKHDFDK